MYVKHLRDHMNCFHITVETIYLSFIVIFSARSGPLHTGTLYRHFCILILSVPSLFLRTTSSHMLLVLFHSESKHQCPSYYLRTRIFNGKANFHVNLLLPFYCQALFLFQALREIIFVNGGQGQMAMHA